MEEKVLPFLKNQQPKLCVLATSKDNQPEAAVVGYAIKDDLSIVLSTHKGTRKLKNLAKNNKAALVFGWSFGGLNIQYEGTTQIIDQGTEYQTLETFFFSQNPDAAKFKTPDTVFIVVKPTWIRYLDLSQNPPKTEEKKFSPT